MKTRILVIDDDVVIQRSLIEILQSLGYEVEVAGKAVDGFGKAYRTKPDLIILDVMLPDMDGWQACQRFREMADTPILFLTALGSEEDVIKGLGLGGDDYLVKPVTINVLKARVRALLRRTQTRRDPSNNTMRYQNLIIDFDRHEVRLNNKSIDLSPTDFKLLVCLVKHQGRVLSHNFLIREVWGLEYLGEVKYLRWCIGNLRKKIEVNLSEPEFIQTVWGVGYRFG